MKKITFYLFVVAFGSFSAFAQYCEPTLANNCTPDAPESITNVTFAGIDNTTGCVAGLNDYTDQVANVSIGETYDLSLTITTDAAFPDDYAFVFIDWNQDGFFDTLDERYLVEGPTGVDGTYTIPITVPANAVEGNTRMRALITWNQPDNDGCAVNYGEVEDYTVNVGTLSIADNNIDGFKYFYSTQSKNLTITANSEMSNITMFNVLGQQVVSKNLSTNNETINLSNLKDGIYLATVKTSSGNVSTFKMVKR
jgi:hypothetical protein